jgi:hypothetical protein
MDESASILTRVRVPDFEAWKPMFDRDEPGARASSTGWQVFRAVEDGNEVFIRVDFASLDEATTARDKLIASGVLEKFPDHVGPTVVQAAEVIDR